MYKSELQRQQVPDEVGLLCMLVSSSCDKSPFLVCEEIVATTHRGYSHRRQSDLRGSGLYRSPAGPFRSPKSQ